MNAIRLLRNQAGITQQALAARAKTSQAAIAQYETGKKSPTLVTVQRLASAVGLEWVPQFFPRLTREDRRSLAYHEAVAKIVRRDPVRSIARAKQNLLKMRQNRAGAKTLFDRWQTWLDLPVEDLISRIQDHGLEARDMRQVSPFAGLLSAQERAAILQRFRRDYSRETK